MVFREASINDIAQLHVVRVAVNENRLSNPDLITHNDYEEFLTTRGKGWLCEMDSVVVGFAIVDLKGNNIWALFVHPHYEQKGIGKSLQRIMLDWYFNQTRNTVWLGTSQKTRAASFYRNAGWTEVGMHGKNELKFEMTYDNWLNLRPKTK